MLYKSTMQNKILNFKLQLTEIFSVHGRQK